jgi:hypothetical protein
MEVRVGSCTARAAAAVDVARCAAPAPAPAPAPTSADAVVLPIRGLPSSAFIPINALQG